MTWIILTKRAIESFRAFLPAEGFLKVVVFVFFCFFPVGVPPKRVSLSVERPGTLLASPLHREVGRPGSLAASKSKEGDGFDSDKKSTVSGCFRFQKLLFLLCLWNCTWVYILQGFVAEAVELQATIATASESKDLQLRSRKLELSMCLSDKNGLNDVENDMKKSRRATKCLGSFSKMQPLRPCPAGAYCNEGTCQELKDVSFENAWGCWTVSCFGPFEIQSPLTANQPMVSLWCWWML